MAPVATAPPQRELELLRAAFDEAPMPLWLIAPDHTVSLANRAAVGMLGYRSTSEVVGTPSHDTLHGSRPDGSPYPADTCPILKQQNPRETAMPEWFIARSGRPLPVTWSARSLEGTGGTLLTFHDASTDGLAATGRPVRDPRHPWGTVTDGVYHDRRELRRAILDHIRERCADPALSTAHLAAEFHISVRSLQVIMAEAGHSPATTIRQMRVELARRLLTEGASVSEAGRASGFRDPGTFARAFRRAYGTSPSAWRVSQPTD